MAEINFKFTTAKNLDGKTVSQDDLIAMNSQITKTTEVDTVEDKLGSTYKGDHIIGTTEAEKLCLNEAITVKGVTVGNVGENTTFAKGTSLQEILQKILCKVIDVKAVAPTAALTPNQSTSHEYGTTIPATAMTLTLTQGKFVGAESGYVTNQAMDCKLVTASINESAATIATNGMSATYTFPEFDLESETVVTATATVTANTIVPVKNDHSNSSVKYNGGSITCSGTRKWIPVYKAFLGYSEKTVATTLTSAEIRALNAAQIDVPMSPAAKTLAAGPKSSTGTSIVIAVPTGYKLTGIQNGVGASILSNFNSTGSVSVTCGSKTVNYNVYVYPITNGAIVEYKNVTIGKA